MRRTTALVVAVTVWALPALVRAQSGATAPPSPTAAREPARGIRLDDAIARARQQEPGLQATRADVESVRGRRQQAALRPNPTATVEARREPGGTDSLVSIGVEWPLELHRRAARVAVADGRVVAAQLSADERERLLVAEVRLRYGRVAAAIREAAVATELAATVERQHRLLRGRADEGAAPRLDADLLDVELRRLEAARDLAQGRAERALLELKPWLGMSPEDPLAVSEGIDALVSSSALGDAPPVGVMAGRSDVRLAREQVAIADAMLEQAKREGRADVALFGSYMRMDAGFPQLGVSALGSPERVRGQFHYVSGGIKVLLPVLNGNQGDVAAARGERAAAAARRHATELAAGAEVAAAMARDRRARQALAAFGASTQWLARRNLEVVRQTFDLGRATIFDVLTEQRRYLEFEQAYIATLLEAWEANVDLRRAVGELK
jgi:outer membrane protein, heavy metal efflux system